MILCKIFAANTECKYPNRNKNMRNSALESYDLFATWMQNINNSIQLWFIYVLTQKPIVKYKNDDDNNK
jgi:hypothetical protein